MKPVYLGTPIGSEASLARTLGVSSHALKTIAGNSSKMYSDFQIPKKGDGGMRKISSPHNSLKLIQKRINRQLLERVEYPDYLFGGLSERDYVLNARRHAHAKALIALDIRDFYPSISIALVRKIFKYLFQLPDAVAETLAKLCTRDGKVPQGACSSSFLANLALHELEHRLVRSLAEQGFTYSRLIDDITISSKRLISKKQADKVITQVAGMLMTTGGFQLKNSKTRFTSASNPNDLMEVTGLWLNRGAPRADSSERRDIRSEVRRCIQESRFDRTSEDFHALHDRTSGRVAKLMRLGHPEAVRYRRALRLCLPLYGSVEILKTKKLVEALRKSPSSSHGTTGYIQHFHRVVMRVNIVARTNKILANTLRLELAKCTPSKTKEEAVHGY